jgi:hypothetical protein
MYVYGCLLLLPRSENGLGGDGATAVAAAVPALTRLEKLYLGCVRHGALRVRGGQGRRGGSEVIYFRPRIPGTVAPGPLIQARAAASGPWMPPKPAWGCHLSASRVLASGSILFGPSWNRQRWTSLSAGRSGRARSYRTFFQRHQMRICRKSTIPFQAWKHVKDLADSIAQRLAAKLLHGEMRFW